MNEATYEMQLGEMKDLKAKAIEALTRGNYRMFGHYAAIWVSHNKEMGLHTRPIQPDPFIELVEKAKEMKKS